MFLIYKEHEIISDQNDNFKIKKPNNEYLSEVASSVATAKKWIDAIELEKPKIEKLVTTIAFSGFYESLYSSYDQYLYDELDQYGENSDGAIELQKEIDSIDLEKTRLNIAKAYVDQFNHYYDLDLKFKSIESPKYYNYSTDQIFCYITKDQLQKLLDILASENNIHLIEALKRNFTSYDGFCSFYSNDINDYNFADLASLDHNVIGVIIEAYLCQEHISLKDHRYITNAIDYDIYDAMNINELIEYEAV